MPAPETSSETEASFQDLTFADALQRLETLVERLDGADPPALEEALDAYEEGTSIARECMRRLDAAELRIERLAIDE